MRKKEKQLSSQYDKYFGRVIIFRKDIIFERENILKSDSIFLLRRDQMLCISVFMFFESVQANFLPGHFWSKVGRQADEYITRGVMFLCFLCIYVCLSPPPGAAVILGFFGGKKKFDPEKSYETFYRGNVPEKPLQTHHDKLTSIISDSSVTTMGIFP